VRNYSFFAFEIQACKITGNSPGKTRIYWQDEVAGLDWFCEKWNET
jgi:hypothetical protein